MPKYPTFTIQFKDSRFSPAVNIPPASDPQDIIDLFGLTTPRPVIFMSGGASMMSPSDIELTRSLVEDAIAKFAEENNITVIDGGTEAGIMQMIGEARQKNNYKFPLIGIAPRLKVQYPGFINPGSEAELQDGHSHFVLVESDAWGAESITIGDLTRLIARQQYPMLGILINGGKIAEQDIYFARAKGDQKIPLLILEGSGRKADEVSTAFKTGETSSKIIKAIISGGDIDLVGIYGGADAMLQKLRAHFGVKTS
jgi:hypothetical protein